MKDLTKFLVGLAAFIGFGLLELVIPCTLGYLMMLSVVWPKKTSHYHW